MIGVTVAPGLSPNMVRLVWYERIDGEHTLLRELTPADARKLGVAMFRHGSDEALALGTDLFQSASAVDAVTTSTCDYYYDVAEVPPT